MAAVALGCKKCRKALQAEKGCTFCDGIRPFLMVFGAESPSLQEVSDRTVAALDKQQKEYSAEADSARDLATKETARSQLRATAAVMSRLIDSVRKLNDDRQKVVSSMTAKEQQTLFLEWFSALPAATRQEMRARMDAAETELNTSDVGWRNILDDQRVQ